MGRKQYIGTKKFQNYYTKSEDQIDLTYVVQEGFHDVPEARAFVESIDNNPENFAYINFKGSIYVVSMETLGRQIVAGKEEIWFRDGEYNFNYGFKGTEKTISAEQKSEVSTKIVKPRISSQWADELLNDLQAINGAPLEVLCGQNFKGPNLVSNSIILLGTTFFDTMIPVHKLNVMDAYFANSPSRWKLDKKGVTAYNPYKEKYEYENSISSLKK